MKTKLITLATLFILTLSSASAEKLSILKISDQMGRTISICIKNEQISETFEFDTKVVFNQIKRNHQTETLDITPFIKPEKEVEEDLPVYNGK